MNLLNCIFTNTLSVRWWIWRCAVVLFGLSVIWLIVWSIFAHRWLDTDRVMSLLSKPAVTTQIDKISDALSGDQYISISAASGFVTNKTWVWFEDTTSILEVSLDGNCEDWFSNNSKKWWLITNKALCVRDTSKQQVLTRAQIMSGLVSESWDDNSINPEFASLMARYPSLGWLMTGGVITITADTLQAVELDVQAMRQDPTIIWPLTDFIATFSVMMVLPLLFMTLLFAVIATLVLFVWCAIYTLITRAIAGIMKYDVTFEQAFSISWLPWMIIKIWWSLVWLDWYVRVLVWIGLIMALVYHHRNQKIS